MSRSKRRFASLLVLLAAFGCSAFAQGTDVVDLDSARSALSGISRATEMAGGLITLGFGIRSDERRLPFVVTDLLFIFSAVVSSLPR